MATANTLALLDALMLEYVHPERLKYMMERHSTVAQIIKSKRVVGDAYRCAVNYGSGGGRSRTIGNAISNSGAVKDKAFLVTQVDDFVVGLIDRKAMYAGQSGGAIKDTLKHVVDSKMMELANNFARSLIADTSGAVGQISAGSDVTTDTITLANTDDVINFQEGDVLQASADKAAARTGTVTIGSVDEDNGTLTVASGNWDDGVSAIAAADYLVAQGDLGNSIAGLDSWLTTPSSGESFYSVDRSVDSAKLAGQKIVGTGMALTEAITRGLMRCYRAGGMIDYIVLSSGHFQELADSLDTKVLLDAHEGKAGFSYISFAHPRGTAKVVSDPFMLPDRAFLLESSSWRVTHYGPSPLFIQQEPDGKYLRSSSADSFEFRGCSYANLVCDAPGHNGVITLTASNITGA